MHDTLQKTRDKPAPVPTGARSPAARRGAAIVCVAAMTMICLYSAFAIRGLVISSTPPPSPFALGTAYRDLAYSGSQTLDLYIPSAAAGTARPLAIFVHGGGMVAGDKANLNPVFLNALASAGYAVASVNYRLAPHDRFPAQIQDVTSAIRYLRAHAQQYRLNSGEFVAFGTSYGGLLVALAALADDPPAFEAGPYRNESSGISAAVDLFGPTDLPGWISATDLRKIFGDDQASMALASPTRHVAAGDPPMLIIQGARDTTVPASQSRELYDKLTASGDQTQLILVRNMGHMFAQVGAQPIDSSLTQIAQDIVGFFDRYRRA